MSFADNDLKQALIGLNPKSNAENEILTEVLVDDKKKKVDPNSILDNAYLSPCACLRYVFVNHTGRMLCFGQNGSSESIVLRPNESIAYSWLECECSAGKGNHDTKSRKRRVHFALTFTDTHRMFCWSKPVCIDSIGVHKRVIRLQHDDSVNFSGKFPESDVDPFGFLQIGDECLLWVNIQQGDTGHQTIVRMHADIALINKTTFPIEIGSRRNDAIVVPQNPLVISERRDIYQSNTESSSSKSHMHLFKEHHEQEAQSRSGTPVYDEDLPAGYLQSIDQESQLSSRYDSSYKDIINIMLPISRSSEQLMNCLIFRQSVISQWSQRLILSNSNQGIKSLLEIPGRIGSMSIWLWYSIEAMPLSKLFIAKSKNPNGLKTPDLDIKSNISFSQQSSMAWKIVQLEPPLWIENITNHQIKCMIRPEYRWESLQYALNAVNEVNENANELSQSSDEGKIIIHSWPSLNKSKYIDIDRVDNNHDTNPPSETDEENFSQYIYTVEANSRISVNIDPREAHAFQTKFVDSTNSKNLWSLPPLRIHYQMFESASSTKSWSAVGNMDLQTNDIAHDFNRQIKMPESLIAKIGASTDSPNVPVLNIKLESTATFINDTNDIIWVMPVDIEKKSKNITWRHEKPLQILGGQSIQTFWLSRDDQPINNIANDDFIDTEIDPLLGGDNESFGVIFATSSNLSNKSLGRSFSNPGATTLIWSEPISLDTESKTTISIPVMTIDNVHEIDIAGTLVNKAKGSWVKRAQVEVIIDNYSSIRVKIKGKIVIENNTDYNFVLRSVPPSIFVNENNVTCHGTVLHAKHTYSPESFKIECNLFEEEYSHLDSSQSHFQTLEAFSTLMDIEIVNENTNVTANDSWKSPIFEVPENMLMSTSFKKPLCYYLVIPHRNSISTPQLESLLSTGSEEDSRNNFEVKKAGVLVAVLLAEFEGITLVSISNVIQPQMILRNETEIPLRVSMPKQISDISTSVVIELKPFSTVPIDQRIFSDIAFFGVPESIKIFGERYMLMKKTIRDLLKKPLDDQLTEESSQDMNLNENNSQDSWFNVSLFSSFFSNKSAIEASTNDVEIEKSHPENIKLPVATLFSSALKEQRRSPASVYDDESQQVVRFRLEVGERNHSQMDGSCYLVIQHAKSSWYKDFALIKGSEFRVNMQTDNDESIYAGELTMEKVTGSNVIIIRPRDAKSPRPSSPRPMFAYTTLTSQSPRPSSLNQDEDLEEINTTSINRVGLNLQMRLRVQIEFSEVSFSEDTGIDANEKPLSNLLHLRLFGTKLRHQVETSYDFKTISNEIGDYGVKRTRNMTSIRFVSGQIDTHSPEAESPIVMSFLPSRDQRCLSFTIAMIEPDKKHNLPAIFEIISLQTSPFLINVEDILLRRVIQTMLPLIASLMASTISKKAILPPKEKRRLQFPGLSPPLLFIEKFDIESLQVMITLKTITLPIFLGLDKTWLTFSPVHLSNIYCSEDVLGKEILAIFIADTILRVPALLGSLEILGNPTGFFRSINDGVYDLFAIPLNQIQQGWGPGLFIRSIAQGWTSLFFHVSEGFLHSLSGFSGSVSRNLDRLSMDPEYMEIREQMRRQAKRSSSFEMHTHHRQEFNDDEVSNPLTNSKTTPFATGIRGLTTGIWGGATGVVTMPMKSAIEEGVNTRSIIKGVGKGLVGAIVKPLGGAAELVAQTSESILLRTGSSVRGDGQEFPHVFELPDTKTNLDLLLQWKYLNLFESCLMSSVVTLEIPDASIGFRKTKLRVLITDHGIRALPFCPVVGLSDIIELDDNATYISLESEGRESNEKEYDSSSISIKISESDGHYRTLGYPKDMFFIPWQNFVKFEESLVQTNLLTLIARNEKAITIQSPNENKLDSDLGDRLSVKPQASTGSSNLNEDITIYRLKFERSSNRREFGTKLLSAKRMFEQKRIEKAQ